MSQHWGNWLNTCSCWCLHAKEQRYTTLCGSPASQKYLTVIWYECTMTWESTLWRNILWLKPIPPKNRSNWEHDIVLIVKHVTLNHPVYEVSLAETVLYRNQDVLSRLRLHAPVSLETKLNACWTFQQPLASAWSKQSLGPPTGCSQWGHTSGQVVCFCSRENDEDLCPLLCLQDF